MSWKFLEYFLPSLATVVHFCLFVLLELHLVPPLCGAATPLQNAGRGHKKRKKKRVQTGYSYRSQIVSVCVRARVKRSFRNVVIACHLCCPRVRKQRLTPAAASQRRSAVIYYIISILPLRNQPFDVATRRHSTRGKRPCTLRTK